MANVSLIAMRFCSSLMVAVVLDLIGLVPAGLQARIIVLAFKGLGNGESVASFYYGGRGGFGSGPRQNHGVEFSAGAAAYIDAGAGGSGDFGGEPSPDTALVLTATAILNMLPGAQISFETRYSELTPGADFNLYDDIDGRGNLLGNLHLPMTSSDVRRQRRSGRVRRHYRFFGLSKEDGFSHDSRRIRRR